MHRICGLPTAHTRLVLRTRWRGNPKLGHCATVQTARWGQLCIWIHHRTEGGVNCTMVASLQRNRRGRFRRHGDCKTRRLGCLGSTLSVAADTDVRRSEAAVPRTCNYAASMGAVKAMQAVRVSALESGDIGLDELNTQADVAAAVSQTDVMEEAAFRSDGPQCAHVCTRVESPARNSGAD